MNKLGIYILKLCNYLDSICPELFYFIPEYYTTPVFTIFRSFLRMVFQNLDFIWNKVSEDKRENYPTDSFLYEFITFVSSHLADKCIPNPDFQESFLYQLYIIVQYKKIASKIEFHPIAKAKLINSFLKSFEFKKIDGVSKIFLKMFKCHTFNDINSDYLPDMSSNYLRNQFVENCLANVKLRDSFLNNALNHLYDTITDLRHHFSESFNISLSDLELKEHKVEARRLYNIFYDMLRVLETTSGLIPLVFLEDTSTFRQRFSDVCLIVIRDAFLGQLGKFLEEIKGIDCN